MSLKSLVHTYFRFKAKLMVKKNTNDRSFYRPSKPMNTWTVAFLTTAGVHLKTQPIFDVEAGDHTIRKLPDTATKQELMITHTHYDTTDANEDINCVYPIDILHQLKEEGIIGDTAKTHYGLMGYIPNTKPLIEESIPLIIQQLKEDGVDILLASPG